MKTRVALGVLAGFAVVPSAHATLIYDTWNTNEGGSPNYIVTVEELAGLFNVEVTVDPWNAEAFGLFVDLGDFTITSTSLSNVSPTGQVTLIANDTTSDSCGAGCNLNGLVVPLADPDSDWEWVFRLGDAGFDSIQTFSFSFSTNGATETNWGTVGIRAQQYCSGTDLLPGDAEDCEDSDKSYGSSTPREVPTPGALTLLGTGLLGLGFLGGRRKVA